MLNKVTLIGWVGRDPEIRITKDGKPVATLSMATSEIWTDKETGERKDKAEWHKIVIFAEPLTKIAKDFVKKGSKIFVEGTLRTYKWQDQSGQTRYSTEVSLDDYNAKLLLLDKPEIENQVNEEAPF